MGLYLFVALAVIASLVIGVWVLSSVRKIRRIRREAEEVPDTERFLDELEQVQIRLQAISERLQQLERQLPQGARGAPPGDPDANEP